MTKRKSNFYKHIPIQTEFGDLIKKSSYSPLPDDWYVGVSDVVDSTGHIAEGRYKMVNTIGAAVISAQINTMPKKSFPYVFGGDGASFAVGPDRREPAAAALSKVQLWAKQEFDVDLRVAMVPVRAIREAGLEVAVARYRTSRAITYAMFRGGGLDWAEQQMRLGQFGIDVAPAGSFPDLSGLSCRWQPMLTKNGSIVSLVVSPHPDAQPPQVARVLRQIVAIADSLPRRGHPLSEAGPQYDWPPKGLLLEAHASRRNMPLIARRLYLLGETAFAMLFFRWGLKLRKFDPRHYLATSSKNADFRKFDDGLKMTLDCDAITLGKLTTILEKNLKLNVIEYGIHEQSEALLTCIVPSIYVNNHVHFVDGADGGYTRASLALKSKSERHAA